MGISGKHWYRTKRGAEKRNLEFSITIEDAWEKYIQQNKTCALSGVFIILDGVSYGNSKIEDTASLDRIDNNKGYTIDNIQWIHKEIQRIKMDITEDKLLNWCYLMCKNKGLIA